MENPLKMGKNEALIFWPCFAACIIVSALLFTDFANFNGVFIAGIPRSFWYMILVGALQVFLAIFLRKMYPRHVDKDDAAENKGDRL